MQVPWKFHPLNHNLPRFKKKYLFAGLGTMGHPMAGHLSKNKNLDLYVYNRTVDVTHRWLNKHDGFEFNFNNSSDMKFNGLITCLKDDDSIVDILINKRLVKYLQKNSFIIDHSTTSLQLVDLINSNDETTENNISFFDAPVSGGEVGAINGTLSIMYGGPNKKISIIESIMNSYSNKITKIGPSGHGQLTKMVNQLCIAGLLQGLSEGVALGKSSNLNMTKVLEAISGGAAQSWQMDNRFKTMVDGNFNFGFAVNLMIKDLKIAIKQSNSNNLDLTISKKVLKKYEMLSKEKMGNLDTSSLIKLFNV